MPADIFGERFYSLREPAWHGLGTVSDTERGAAEAFNAMTPYSVSLAPMFTEVNGQRFETAYQAIMIEPTPDQPEYRLASVVGSDYTLVTPLRICEIFDEALNRPVETLGALGNGDTLFITTRLPAFQVRGDDVEPYLLVVSPYTGDGAIQVRVTNIRVVCSNTLQAAKAESSESWRIVHDAQVEDRVLRWMGGIWERFELKSKGLSEAFTKMADVRVREEDVEPMLQLIYPDPRRFSWVPDPEVNARREQWYEENLATVRRRRQAVQEVFGGKGIGQDTPAANWTVWGLYNAVAEFEQYRPTTNASSAAADMLFGSRSAIVERGFDTLLEYAIASRDAQPAQTSKYARSGGAKPRKSRAKVKAQPA